MRTKVYAHREGRPVALGADHGWVANATVPWAKKFHRALHEQVPRPVLSIWLGRLPSSSNGDYAFPPRTGQPGRTPVHPQNNPNYYRQPGRRTRRRIRLGGTNAFVLVSRGPAGRGDSASQRLEAGSFEDFFTEWYPRVVAFVMQRRGGATEADAHDAAQNAMIQLLRCWGRPDYPKAYLFKVALREYASVVKDHERHGRVAIEDDLASAESDRSKEGEIDNRLLIVELVRKLSPAERDVVGLDLCDLSTEQIAEILGKPQSTVRSLRRNAHNHLKALRDGGATQEGGTGP